MTEVDADWNGSDYEKVWEGSGFSKNPYDPRPLKISADDRELFVGRSSEQQQFKIQASGSEGGIVIVEGPIGVGKTSFVNAMLFDKWNPEGKKAHDRRKSYSYLPSFETLQLKENFELADFMLSALSNCIFSLERIHSLKISDTDPDLKAGKELVANTVRAGVGGFNVSILGSGVGFDRKEALIPASTVPLPTIMNTMDRWFDRVAERFGYEAILVPINNLDVLQEKSVIGFLNSARDTLLSRHRVWWILVGGPGLFFTLETNARRVSELITGQPVILRPMSLKEVQEAVDARVEKFKMTKNVKAPIPEEAVKLLYDSSDGEVRYIFKRLSDIVYEFRATFPSERQIPLDVAIRSLRILAKRKIDSKKLTNKELEILRHMASQKTFRIRDYPRFGLQRAQALQRLVSKFLTEDLLVRAEKSPKEVYYSTQGDVNILFRGRTDA
ncbi:MAG: P-loop NTPase family protein [Nitrososphaerales archaeon]